MTPTDPQRGYQDGRDEMNLADFPISALPRHQLSDGQGGKLDRLEFTATRYDPVSRRRIEQRVTLTSTARDGLPTPADEHVILALLYVAKHGTNFAEPIVRFAPGRLFDIMGWSPNGRSYVRLRDVLRRLKALTIRYENAWWDAAGRGYEEEVATGIISSYRIARQVSGPRTAAHEPQSWVTWTPQFHDSLKNGNLKRLDLDLFFRLGSPTAQRMYRFLDKRFYNSPIVSMDLVEFACGHIGLSATDNVAILKRRLTPAIEELEKVGFLAAVPVEERYQKVRPGVWRIHLRRPLLEGEAPAEPRPSCSAGASPSNDARSARVSDPASRSARVSDPADAEALAREFYRQWDPTTMLQPGVKDVQQARLLLERHDADEARALLLLLVQVTRKQWPECRSLSGAAQKYLGEALRLHEQRRQREANREMAEEVRRRAQQQTVERERQERELLDRWNALPDAEREAIRAAVLRERGDVPMPEAFVRRLCLEELARRK
jgi:hypothetical protein